MSSRRNRSIGENPAYNVKRRKRDLDNVPTKTDWFLLAVEKHGPIRRTEAWKRAGELRKEGFGKNVGRKAAVDSLIEAGVIEVLPGGYLVAVR